MRADDFQVEIRIGPGLSTGPRTEGHHSEHILQGGKALKARPRGRPIKPRP
jgi:hypothetical protein